MRSNNSLSLAVTHLFVYPFICPRSPGELRYAYMPIAPTKKRIRGSLLLSCVLALGGCGNDKASEIARFRKVAAVDPRIENVSIEGYQDLGTYKVLTVSFTIRDKQDSQITLVPDGEGDLNSLRILRIGPISPVMFEFEPQLGWVTPRSPTLGSDPTYRPPHPWKDMDLSTLVSRYDDVIAYFSKWPTAPNFETIKTDGGTEVRCRIDPADDSTMREFIPPGD